MAGPVDELRQAVRAFAPAQDLAQSVLKMISQASALVAAGDKVAVLVAREAEITKAIADAEAVYAAKMAELQDRHDAQHDQNAKDEAAARAETDRIIARTKREATDFIKSTEDQRAIVQKALEADQAKLVEFRKLATAETDRAFAERDGEVQAHLAKIANLEAEAKKLAARVAELQKADAEISARLAAVSAARR